MKGRGTGVWEAGVWEASVWEASVGIWEAGVGIWEASVRFGEALVDGRRVRVADDVALTATRYDVPGRSPVRWALRGSIALTMSVTVGALAPSAVAVTA